MLHVSILLDVCFWLDLLVVEQRLFEEADFECIDVGFNLAIDFGLKGHNLLINVLKELLLRLCNIKLENLV